MVKALRESTPRIWSTTFVILILISFAATGVVDSLQAGLPVFVESIGGTKTTSGLLVTVFALAGVLPFLACGPLVDRYGCRVVLIVSAVVFLFGGAAPLFVDGIPSLYVSRAFQGIGFAGLNVATAAGATNVLPRERLGEGVGYYGLGQSLAIALGPALGLKLVSISPSDPKTMWIVVALLAAFCLVASLCCFCDRERAPETHEGSTPSREKRSGFAKFLSLFVERKALLPSAMILIVASGVCCVIVFVGVFSRTSGFGNAGLFFIISAAMMIATRFASGLFMDRYRPLYILLPALAFSALALVLLSAAHSRAATLLAGAPFGLGFGVIVPLLGSVAVKRSPRERSGAANSMYYLALNLGFGFGAFLGGTTIDLFGFRPSFLLWLTTILAPAALGVLFLRDEPTRSRSENNANHSAQREA